MSTDLIMGLEKVMLMVEREIRVAAYCRVSTDRQDDSLPNQEKYFTEYISKQDGWKFVGVYCDTYTGTNTLKREGFNKMIEDAYDGKIDLILTKEVSRFARNTLDSIGYTRELIKRGVNVIFTLDNVDTRHADHEFKLTIFASIAQEESRKTSERVKWGHKREMEKGVVFGRREMWGYRIVDKTKMEIVEEEAKIVRDVFRMYLIEGNDTIQTDQVIHAVKVPTN